MITLQESRGFGKLSGDVNPLHVDPEAARRLLFGEPVAHGVNSILRMLEHGLATGRLPDAVIEMKAVLRAPVFLEKAFNAEYRATAPGKHEIHLIQDGRDVAKLDIKTSADHPASTFTCADRFPDIDTIQELDDQQIAEAAGAVDICIPQTAVRNAFPRLSERSDYTGLMACLLSVTRVIGMHCPGLHSLISEIRVAPASDGPDSTAIARYKVKRFDPRFRMVSVAITAAGWLATVTAFVRPKPVAQPHLKQILTLPGLSDWRGQHALVIGGSRGLGELTAKLVAAGGGEVTLTYRSGESDAAAIAAEIAAVGGTAHVARYDSIAPANVPAPPGATRYSHIFYFASDRIRPSTGGFNNALFRQYIAQYLEPLTPLLEALQPYSREKLALIWPSSVFVESPQPGFAEYAAAKAATESWSRYLALQFPHVKTFMPRLPRLNTDQTQSIIPLETANSLDTMIAILGGVATATIQKA